MLTGMTNELELTHRELPLSVQDGDERLALEDDLAGGETPAGRGSGHLVGRGGGTVDPVVLGRLPLHDRPRCRWLSGSAADDTPLAQV